MKIKYFLPVMVILTACAPVPLGSSVTNPKNISLSGLSSMTIVDPGKTTYIAVTYNASTLNIPDALIDREVPVNFDDQNAIGNINSLEASVNWITLKPSDIPKGWKIALARSVLIREIVKTTQGASSINVRYYDRVKLTYAITAPNTNSTKSLKFRIETPKGGGDSTTLLVSTEQQ